MDEPCSALDPIATAKVEDLIHSLKEQYTIVRGDSQYAASGANLWSYGVLFGW